MPEYDIVRKMKGVGNKICPRIIAEVGDVRKYKNANSLIASAGIDTPPYQSGKFTATHIHISKRGNKYLKKCGYEIMKSLKATKPINDSSVYDYIEKKEEEIGISWRHLQILEHNEENTRISTFKKIIKALNVPDDEIIKFIKK